MCQKIKRAKKNLDAYPWSPYLSRSRRQVHHIHWHQRNRRRWRPTCRDWADYYCCFLIGSIRLLNMRDYVQTLIWPIPICRGGCSCLIGAIGSVVVVSCGGGGAPVTAGIVTGSITIAHCPSCFLKRNWVLCKANCARTKVPIQWHVPGGSRCVVVTLIWGLV